MYLPVGNSTPRCAYISCIRIFASLPVKIIRIFGSGPKRPSFTLRGNSIAQCEECLAPRKGSSPSPPQSWPFGTFLRQVGTARDPLSHSTYPIALFGPSFLSTDRYPFCLFQVIYLVGCPILCWFSSILPTGYKSIGYISRYHTSYLTNV